MFSGPDLEALARAKKILETPARELGPYNMGEKYVISEVSSNAQWEMITGQNTNHLNTKDVKQKSEFKNLTAIKPNQVMLIDIYTGWSGPCNAIESHLRRMRNSFVEAPNCLALTQACCDEIDELEPFKQ